MKKLFFFLKSRCSPLQISLGILFGLLLGLNPHYLSLQNFIIIPLIFFIRVPWRHFCFSLASGLVLGFLFVDKVSHEVGLSILKIESLKEFFTLVHSIPLVSFSNFNNTVTLGGTIISLCLFPLIFMASKSLKTQS